MAAITGAKMAISTMITITPSEIIEARSAAARRRRGSGSCFLLRGVAGGHGVQAYVAAAQDAGLHDPVLGADGRLGQRDVLPVGDREVALGQVLRPVIQPG